MPYISVPITQELNTLLNDYIPEFQRHELYTTIIHESPNRFFKSSFLGSSNLFNHLHKCIFFCHKIAGMINYLDMCLNLFTNNEEILNAQTCRGHTYLHLACVCPVTKIRETLIKLLLSKGIKINVLCSCNYNELHIACLQATKDKNNVDQDASFNTIKLLVSAGIDINQKNWYGTTCLSILLISNCDAKKEIIKYLIEKGANLDKNHKKTIKERYPNIIETKANKLARIINNNTITIKECNICFSKTNTIDCHYKHSLCVLCLLKSNNFECFVCNNNKSLLTSV